MYLVLIVITLAVYAQVRDDDFVTFDDPFYVIDNPNVKADFTLNSVVWAFTTGHFLNWHPLTWLSYMLDYQMFGLKAGGYHVENLIFHVLNTLLLFEVLRRMNSGGSRRLRTAALWPSAFAAALFAIHPLHVESVAWIAERKDVLSTFFWLSTMAAYTAYVRKRGSEEVRKRGSEEEMPHASQPHRLMASRPHSLTASQPHSLTASQPHSLTASCSRI